MQIVEKADEGVEFALPAAAHAQFIEGADLLFAVGLGADQIQAVLVGRSFDFLEQLGGNGGFFVIDRQLRLQVFEARGPVGLFGENAFVQLNLPEQPLLFFAQPPLFGNARTRQPVGETEEDRRQSNQTENRFAFGYVHGCTSPLSAGSSAVTEKVDMRRSLTVRVLTGWSLTPLKRSEEPSFWK